MTEKTEEIQAGPSGPNVPVGKDKILHFTVVFIFVIALAPYIGPLWAPIAGIGLGIGKEVYDHFHGGNASVADIIADLAGVVVACLVITIGGIG